jgi:hypothetical protein
MFRGWRVFLNSPTGTKLYFASSTWGWGLEGLCSNVLAESVIGIGGWS